MSLSFYSVRNNPKGLFSLNRFSNQVLADFTPTFTSLLSGSVNRLQKNGYFRR